MQVLSAWIDSFTIDTVGPADVVKVRFLLRPTINWLVEHDQSEVLSPDIIGGLVTKIFGAVLAEDSEGDELFQSEVIQICVALVQHVPHLLREHKKLIIQCIWYVYRARSSSPALQHFTAGNIDLLQVDPQEGQHREIPRLSVRRALLPGVPRQQG